MNLPKPIAAYFQSKNSDASQDASEWFTLDATIIDEGENKQYVGRDAIRNWMTGEVAGYSLTTEVTSVREEGQETIVMALVSGDFPGSPAEFRYWFVLKGDLISRLRIEFIGFKKS